MGGSEAARRLEPVDPRHAHVEEDEIGVHLVRERERLLATRRFAQSLEAGCRLDYFAGDTAEYRLVVDDHDAHAEPGVSSCGRGHIGVGARSDPDPCANGVTKQVANPGILRLVSIWQSSRIDPELPMSRFLDRNLRAR
jgi:hypothetical protein